MWGLIGHEYATERLCRSVREGRVSHAYLVEGPARVGKSTLALRLSQAVNCQAAGEPPCGECRSCRRIERGTHLDVRIIQLEAGAGDPADADDREQSKQGVKNIRLNQVRSLLREVALAPHEGRYKVYQILNAENLSVDASNSLLKVLEEPPSRVVLILTTTDANMLLPTIVSRCQVIRLQSVAAATIAEHLLRGQGLDPEGSQLLARLAGGRPGWALDAARDETVLAERREAMDRLVSLADAGSRERLSIANEMAGEFGRDRGGVYLLLDYWLSWWRDVLLTQAGLGDMVGNCDRRETLRKHATCRTPAGTHAYLARVEAARAQLEQNVNPRLALEALLLNIPEVRTV